VRKLCADLSGLLRAAGFRGLGGQLSCVMSFGSGAWDRLFGASRPKELHPFRGIRGVQHAVSTPGDILSHIRLFHIHSQKRIGLCLELAAQIMSRLGDAVATVDEVHGFTCFIGYARSPRRIERMLENMFVGRPHGNYDRLLDFSRAVTGALFFVPTATFFDNVEPGAPDESPVAKAPGGAGEAASPPLPCTTIRSEWAMSLVLGSEWLALGGLPGFAGSGIATMGTWLRGPSCFEFYSRWRLF